MKTFGWVITGGFAKGYRTYLISAGMIIAALINYAVGDNDLSTLIKTIAAAAGLITAAQH